MDRIAGRVQRHVETLVATGAESGLQVAVHRHGDLVVDAAAGSADPAHEMPLLSTTPIFSFSTGKNIAATVAHLLVSRGLLAYDSRVADVWPEFGQHGKEEATVAHVLTHTVGLPALPCEITPDLLSDRAKVCAALAAATPRWPPGSAMGYHAYTFGFLIGEMARRTTGRSMSELLQQWINEPLGLAGQLHFAVPETLSPPPAVLEQDEQERSQLPTDRGTVFAPWEGVPSSTLGNDRRILGADVPSVGTATARGLSSMFDGLLQGRILDPAQTAAVTALAFEGQDQVTGHPVRMALDYPLGRLGAGRAGHAGQAAIGWAGGGGSYAYADPSTGIAFGLTKTRLVPNFDTALSVIAILDDHLERSGPAPTTSSNHPPRRS